ncbi:MAG: SCO family protein [Deinococcota bacterium]
MKRLLLSVLVVLSLGTVALGYMYFNQPQQEIRGTALDNPHYVGDVALVNSQLGDVRLDRWQGQTTLVFFGFTRCPDVCPATMARLASIYDTLESPDDVQVVMITVDPMYDTPEIVDQYASAFHEEFVGLGGTSQTVAEAARSFFIGYRDLGNGLMSHTDVIAILDKDSNLRYVYGQDKLRHLQDDLTSVLAMRDF